MSLIDQGGQENPRGSASSEGLTGKLYDDMTTEEQEKEWELVGSQFQELGTRTASLLGIEEDEAIRIGQEYANGLKRVFGLPPEERKQFFQRLNNELKQFSQEDPR